MAVLSSVSQIKHPVRRILLFRIGQLGDSVVALPTLLALREQFPDASISWLADRHLGSNFVSSEALVDGLDLVDSFYFYPVKKTSHQRLRWCWAMLRLVLNLRRKKFDLVLRLDPEKHSKAGEERDRRFFKLCGISSQLTVSQFREGSALREPVRPLPSQIHEVDFYQNALEQLGIKTVEPKKAFAQLQTTSSEELTLIQAELGEEQNYIGVGVGSKMPAKRWAESKFLQLLERLVMKKGVTPVFLGGSEDTPAAERMIEQLGRGVSFCGRLSLRGSVCALARCRIYIGNDTGTMHLAVAADRPCLAIFSARDVPGKWYPYGAGHKVLREAVECEGCMLVECIEQGNKCLERITVEEAFAASISLLADEAPPPVVNTANIPRLG